MFCEPYREALTEAVLSGEQPARLKAHLEVCSSCRGWFTEEQALLERIEVGMRGRANAEPPASLLPRVRQEIAATRSAQTWRVLVLAYVASGLAIGAIALSFALRSKVSPLKPEPLPRTASLPASHEPSAHQRESVSKQLFVVAGEAKRRPPRALRNAEPQVLVSAEEQLGLQRYVASLRSAKAEAAGVIKGNTSAEIEPLEIASVEVKQLSIRPLESGDTN